MYKNLYSFIMDLYKKDDKGLTQSEFMSNFIKHTFGIGAITEGFLNTEDELLCNFKMVFVVDNKHKKINVLFGEVEQ